MPVVTGSVLKTGLPGVGILVREETGNWYCSFYLDVVVRNINQTDLALRYTLKTAWTLSNQRNINQTDPAMRYNLNVARTLN